MQCTEAWRDISCFSNSKTPMLFHTSGQCHASMLFYLSRIFLLNSCIHCSVTKLCLTLTSWTTAVLKWSEVAQSCSTLCDLMDCSLQCSSIHGIFQARVLEWVAICFSRGSSWPRDWILISCIVGRCFTIWATREEVPNLFLTTSSSYFFILNVFPEHMF